MQRLLARASQKPFTLTTQALIPVISRMPLAEMLTNT